MELRFLDSELEVRQEERGLPTIKGIASVTYDGSKGTEYHLGDNVYERFAPGAFDNWLETNPEVLCFFNHDRSKLLARTPDTLKLWADKKGLHYEATLSDTSYARDLVTLIKDKQIRGSSFAFLPISTTWEREGKKEIRWVREATVDEVSPVIRPAYSKSEVQLRDMQDRSNWLNSMATERIIARLDEILKSLTR